MRIVLIGPPGSGKGTLAQELENKFGFTHISIGQLIRQEASNNPKLAALIAAGNLVDDATTKKILENRLSKSDCQKGFVLDGYPRSLSQAENLAEVSDIDVVLKLNLDSKEIFNLLGKRLSCLNCNAVYNTLLTNATTCQKCGSKLVKRADDNLKSIQNRIDIYNKNIGAILDFYGSKVVEIEVANTPEKTLEIAEKILMGGGQIGCKR